MAKLLRTGGIDIHLETEETEVIQKLSTRGDFALNSSERKVVRRLLAKINEANQKPHEEET